jgi:MoCo/4Fe-4S cofactor protein with predicted Tat translocation signal
MSELNQNTEISQENATTNDSSNQKNRPLKIERQTGIWRSFEEKNHTEEFQKSLSTEFMSSPLRSEFSQEGTESDGVARRDFLKLMGASVALTTAAGCIRRPVQKLVPYNKQPEEVTLGVPNYYTSTFFDGQEGFGLLIKSREGRPVHIEGNPNNPLNGSAVSVRAQASLLSLYDPERLQKPFRNLLNEKKTNKETVRISWEDLDKKVVEELKKGGVAVLTGNLNGPSTKAVVADFCSGFNADHYVWEPLAQDDVLNGQKISYGEAVVPLYKYDEAKVIVSIDADFLGAWGPAIQSNRLFANGRRNPSKMSRLISFDSTYSLTAANADVRVRIKPSNQFQIIMGLIAEIFPENPVGSGYKGIAEKIGIDSEVFKKVASDLKKNKRESIVVTGGLQTRTEDSEALQVAVNYLNHLLENDGRTILSNSGNQNLSAQYESLITLISKMKSGSVKTLIIYRQNPIYNLAKSFGFHEAIAKVATVVFIGDQMDETASLSQYIATDSHALESWNDSEFANGLFGIHQPLIRSMYDTRSFQLSLMTWGFMAAVGPRRLQDYETFHEYLRAFWKVEMSPKLAKGQDFETFWNQTLQFGTVGTVSNSSVRSFKTDALSKIKGVQKSSDLELALYPTSHIGDGTLANVAWLQELPNPVSKIVWDNYASVSMKTADRLNLKQGDLIELTSNGVTVTLPTHIQPGLHDGVVAVAVGYGRTHAGKVGNDIGQNAYVFAKVETNNAIFSGAAVDIKKTGKKYDLVTTQGHDSMEGRQIVVQATNKDYEKSKSANIHKHHTWSMWSGHQYNGHKWGMAIDLNTCTGCSACMTACRSENNIHVVGKKYIMQGREMDWIRIDRYYVGDTDNAQAVFQPIMCQHCDNAPCETVCPVAATVHSSEGLNEIVYNRCVGTRYCSNNCPYKVRRFNWFNYAKLIEKPMHMALNPEVGVRTRGVMEKCTFCVQRIKDGKNVAKTENRSLKDGDIKVACESACPTQAITFGDLNDENSRVAKTFKSEERSYALLEEWYAKPSVRYMSKIRNNDLETVHSAGSGGDHA